MPTMAGLFASGRAVDIVLVVLALELAWLTVRRGWRVGDALLRLGPGALMLLALRGALIGADWRWIALAGVVQVAALLALAWGSRVAGAGQVSIWQVLLFFLLSDTAYR